MSFGSEARSKFVADLISKIGELNTEKVGVDVRNVVQKSLKNLPSDLKDNLAQWAESVNSIRANEALSSSEKEKAIADLPTETVALNLIQSVLDTLINQAPIPSRGFFKSGMGIAASMIGMQFGPAASIAIRMALPKLLLSDPGALLSTEILSACRTQKQLA